MWFNIDYVQIGLIAIASLGVLGIALGNRPISAVLLALVTALVLVLVVFDVTAALYALISHGDADPQLIAPPLLIASLVIIFVTFVANLNERLSVFRNSLFLAWVSAILSVAAVTLILAPDLKSVFGKLNFIVGPTRDAVLYLLQYLCLANSSQDGAPPREVLDHASATLGITLAALSAGSIAVSATGTLANQIQRLIDRFNLADWQKQAAETLRSPARNALGSRTLSRLYPNELRIERYSAPRQIPFGTTTATKPGRILLIADVRNRSGEGENFSIERITDLVGSANLDIRQSIFLVCAIDQSRQTEVVAYGTGHELIELSNDHFVNASISRQFYSALDRGERDEIIDAVNRAREELLHHQSESGVLLSTVTCSVMSEIIHVLRRMAKKKLDRILLVSRYAPYGRGILGAGQIGAYLQRTRAVPPHEPSDHDHAESPSDD